MEVTLDKFGRILIPKKLRELLHLRPGQRLELLADEMGGNVMLIPKSEQEPKLVISESGFPVFQYDPSVKIDTDVVEMIKQNREAYMDKQLGI